MLTANVEMELPKASFPVEIQKKILITSNLQFALIKDKG